jgi:hypothetical protein
MRARLRVAVAVAVALLGLGCLVAPSSAIANPGQRLDLKILVIGAAAGDPTTDAWTTELGRQGIPHAIVRPGQPLPALENPKDPNHGHYNGVVLGTHASLLGDLSQVYAYERKFGVRQISGYEFPNPSVGLTYTGQNVAGPFTAQLTAAGKGAFNYLAGPVPLDEGSMAYDAYDAAALDAGVYENFASEAWTGEPISQNFVPYLLTPTAVRGSAVKGRIIGGFFTHTGQDPSSDPKAGVQEVVLTFNYNPYMTQWRLLAPGLIRWVTKGVHLGYNRNYLSNHVDDVFLADDLWSVEHKCTPAATQPVDPFCAPGVGGDPDGPTVKMTAADVDKVLQWQRSNGFRLDLAYNAVGASATDPLTAALLRNKASFGWINHTWSHPYLGCQAYRVAGDPGSGCSQWPSGTDIKNEITKNTSWATTNKIPNFDPKTLVTGEHSGLDNPNMPRALTETGITNIASDNSRPLGTDTLGSATLVPRHPSSVYYNVSTWAELVDEYNQLYLSPEAGGKCVPTAVTTCRSTPATKEEILANETQIMLRNVMSNDPRPGYSHQSNLAHDQLILQVLGEVIQTYKSWFANNAPLVTPTQAAAGGELGRQRSWQAAVKAGTVQASVQDGTVTVTTTANVEVPLTLAGGSTTTTVAGSGKNAKPTTVAFGQSYAGSQSAWTLVRRGTSLTVSLPA